MRLYEHPDFEQAVLRASDHFRARGLRPALIEKDYYVTELLRVVARAGRGVIFKGGTSLSKGWSLIERFSEDIDIFLDPRAVTPALGAHGINRELKHLRDLAGAHPGLKTLPGESQTIGGRGRRDYFGYAQRLGGPGEVEGRVLLESGTASGREPTIEVTLSSYLAQFLGETGHTLGAEDEASFVMQLLHFRRTFVEKLFAIHAKVEILKREGRSVGSHARHYYDLYQLAARTEVRDMLDSPEYAAIKEDYDQISRAHFERDYAFPRDMRFALSDALFPDGKLETSLARDYEQQCRLLCFGPIPGWNEVRARFDALRGVL